MDYDAHRCKAFVPRRVLAISLATTPNPGPGGCCRDTGQPGLPAAGVLESVRQGLIKQRLHRPARPPAHHDWLVTRALLVATAAGSALSDQRLLAQYQANTVAGQVMLRPRVE